MTVRNYESTSLSTRKKMAIVLNPEFRLAINYASSTHYRSKKNCRKEQGTTIVIQFVKGLITRYQIVG